MRSIAAVVCALVAVAAFADVPAQKTDTQPSSVTIPLSRYDELQKAQVNASATVIDTMTLAGTFRDHNLSLTLTGRSVGTRAATSVISEAPDLTLSGCSGEALLVRSGKGTYDVIALGPAFTLRCDARPSGSDRLKMSVASSVLAVRAAVGDGELITGDEDSGGARAYTLVRQVVGANETLATTATGRYLITLLPDATRFRYTIQVHNPNRNTSPLPLHLVSGEHLQQIDSTATYEPKDGSYIFAMPPGDSTITLSGELKGKSFAAPVAASLQYVVVESHPLLRPAMQSQAKRVSAGETGITTEYRGALAFEIGAKERISWTVTRLEALRAISYAVRSIRHTLFVPANGPVLGESELMLDNQGAPELELPRKPEPTFVSLQNEPVLMTKNAAGELSVPLSAGAQRIIVQHRQPISQLGIVFARLDVPRLPVPATNTNVTLRYPEHWLPVWQSFATQATTWHPDGETFFVFVLLVLWIERVLAFLTMKLRGRVIAALLLAYAALLIPILLWAVVLFCSLVTVLWVASQRPKISLRRLATIVAVGAIVLLVALLYTMSRPKYSSDDFRSGSGGIASVGRAENTETTGADALTGTTGTSPAPQSAPRAKMTPPAGSTLPYFEVSSTAYQGLPAKFEMPDGVRGGSFNEQMLAPERPQTITLVLISMTLLTWLAAAMTVIALWLLWHERSAIRAGVQLRMGEARPVTA